MIQRPSSIAVALLASVTAAGAALAQGQAPHSHAALVPGDVVTTFEAVGVDGVSRRIEYPKGSNTVLLFFLSSCPTCHKMLPVWSEYYQRRPKNLAVVGVMLDSPPPGFFNAMPIPFPVVRSPGPTLNKAYKIEHVPMTLRIGPGGKVEEVAEGILDPIRMGQIFRP